MRLNDIKPAPAHSALQTTPKDAMHPTMNTPTAHAMPRSPQLTNAEFEVLLRLSDGEGYARIARRLGLGTAGVRRHIASIYRKMRAQHSPGAHVQAGRALTEGRRQAA